MATAGSVPTDDLAAPLLRAENNGAMATLAWPGSPPHAHATVSMAPVTSTRSIHQGPMVGIARDCRQGTLGSTLTDVVNLSGLWLTL